VRGTAVVATLLLVLVIGGWHASRVVAEAETATETETAPPAEAGRDSAFIAFRPSRLTIPAHDRRTYAHLLSLRTFGPPGLGQTEAGGSTFDWAARRKLLCAPRRIELSRLDYVLQGAGAGANAAMFIGAMANSAGLWDERTSWYLVGAAAGLGAVLGGTVGVPEDSGSRVRIEWEP